MCACGFERVREYDSCTYVREQWDSVVLCFFTQVRSDIKLPVLYLIDSIVKNVAGPYLTLFTHNIVNTFCNVFEKVNKYTSILFFLSKNKI